MASQPANTTISVNRRIRAMRDDQLHTSVKHRTTPFEDLVMSVPGEEILVTETRDSTFLSDAFRFGHPIVVEPRTKALFETAAEGIANLDFPVRLPGNPRDAFLQKTSGNEGDDIHANLRAVAPAPRGLFVEV